MRISTKRLLTATLSPCLILALPLGAHGQVQATDTAAQAQVKNTYLPAFFDQYAPRTALDMVTQVPGFAINSGDQGRRGLGQGGANVLINGERLTGKADVFDELRQLLASNVVAIRIVDGASLDIPGLSGQVADIETRPSAFSGSWEWNPEFRPGRQPLWNNGRVNISGTTDLMGGNLDWSAFARDFSFRGGADGVETRSTASGEVFETRLAKIRNVGDRPGVGGKVTWKPREGHTANINGEYAIFNFNRSVDEFRQSGTGEDVILQTRSDSFEDEIEWELGADYELPLLGGTFKTIGFLNREESPTRNTFAVFDPVTGFTGASRFDQKADEAESILRGEYSWSPKGEGKEGRSWQLGAEAAFNSLEIEQLFSTRESEPDFPGGVPDMFEVSEDRYEATLTHSRPFGDNWDLQASVGVEYSELSQMRDGGQSSKAFIRPKGFVAATYKASETFKIRARVEREVGQLNFFDFVASVDLVDDLGRTGNANLVPAQSWLGSVEFDKDFGQGNTLVVEVFGAQISDIVDRIPVGLDGDAVGNLDSATRYGMEATLSLRGEKWGLPGTELDAELFLRRSSLEDPLLGFDRQIGGQTKMAWEVSVRHDIPGTDWAYGGFVEDFENTDQFRTFSIANSGNRKPFGGVFVEHKDLGGVKARVRLLNVFDTSEFFERAVFDGRRDRGTILRREEAGFAFGQILQFQLSGEF